MAKAIARPRPRPEPVIMAIFPSSDKLSLSMDTLQFLYLNLLFPSIQRLLPCIMPHPSLSSSVRMDSNGEVMLDAQQDFPLRRAVAA